MKLLTKSFQQKYLVYTDCTLCVHLNIHCAAFLGHNVKLYWKKYVLL